ncbi:hypothetical protein ABIT13_09560, partial [Limnospira fusiformis NRMCF6962]
MFQRSSRGARQETQGQSHFKKSQNTVQIYLGGVLNHLVRLWDRVTAIATPNLRIHTPRVEAGNGRRNRGTYLSL